VRTSRRSKTYTINSNRKSLSWDIFDSMQRGRLPYILIPIAAFIPVLPLILNGCSCGHDFAFHIVSWLEAARQFAHGNLHPQWAFTPAFDAGEPRFVFYPPISWTLGAILGLLMPWQWTPIAYIWIVLTASGLSLHHLARHFVPPTAALLASVFYIANPYMLFTAYERAAYAELLAAIWIPLLLLAVLRDQITISRIAVPVALLWLTNAPAAVMSCYALALLTTVRLITTPRTTTSRTVTSETNTSGFTTFEITTEPGAPHLASEMWVSHERATAFTHARTTTTSRAKLALNTATGTALGLALAAIYLVPAAYERRYVHINLALTPGLRIQDNFLFRHTTAGLTNPTLISDALIHDQILHTASIVAVLLIILATITLGIILTSKAWVPHPSQHLAKGGIVTRQMPTLYSLVALTVTITLILTPISAPIWNHAPELHFLQFPWRFVAILAAALSLAIAIALSKIRLTPIATTTAALTIAAALAYPAYTHFRYGCDPEDTAEARAALFHSNLGSDATDEYTPITADNDALDHNNPPYWLSPNPKAPAPPDTQPGLTPLNLTLNSPILQTLILNLRDYPSWHITLNNQPITTRQPRPDGLIAIPIPAGSSQIDITYTTPRDKIFGALLTILALIILSLLLLRDRTRA
jgi:hypothetical protein